MDTPNILHIAADWAARSNPGLHGTGLITRPQTAASTRLIPSVSVSVSACLGLQNVMERPPNQPTGADNITTSGFIVDSLIGYMTHMFCDVVYRKRMLMTTQWGAEPARLVPNLGLQLSMWKSSLLHCFSGLAGWKSSLKQNSIQVRLRSHSEGGQWDHWSGASRNREDCFFDLN